MNVDVSVTDAGLLQVTVDGMTWPPLPVEVVPALAAKVPDAQAAGARQQTTAAVRALTDVLITSGQTLVATVHVGPLGVEAEVDEESYERAREALGVTADGAGDLRHGRMVVRRRKAPPAPGPVVGFGALVAPAPQVSQEPAPGPAPAAAGGFFAGNPQAPMSNDMETD